MIDRAQFTAQTERLVHGLLRDALGFAVECPIPYYQGIVGYMVNCPMLWIRQSRFPILFVAYDGHRQDILADIVKQLENARTTSYFALLVVVPTRHDTGNEAEELRHLVSGSVYRHDFVVLDREHVASIVAANSSQRLIEIILAQGIELSSLSPYVIRGPVPANMFFGREREIKTITQSIQRGNYAIVGGRRIGKSSILQRVDRLLDGDPRYQPCYLSCEDVFDRTSFYQSLQDRFEGLVSDGARPVSFRRLLAEIGKVNGPKKVVLLLDEVDALLEADAAEEPSGYLFRSLRALSHEQAGAFVFSGSKTLHGHLHDASSPFFNFCEDTVLGPLTQRSVAEIVSKPMQQLGLTLEDEEAIIDGIIELTSCHPSLVQWLCNQLVHSAARRRISLEDLKRAGRDPDFHHYYLETAWGDATPLERLISVLIEAPEFSRQELMAAASRLGLLDELAITRAMDTLKLYSLVSERGDRYRFQLARFPEVVRQAEDLPLLIESWLAQLEA